MNPTTIGRVRWPGPVGIGAGLIKNSIMLVEYAKYASAIEIGSITRHLHEGNSGQTVWRYLPEQSLHHNVGMANFGAEHLAADLIKIQDNITVPWGINIAVTPGILHPQEAAIDVRDTLDILLVSGLSPDWITFNIASPDTSERVEVLSAPNRVENCLIALQTELSHFESIPLWLKVGPSMMTNRLHVLADLCIQHHVEAIICGNTLPDIHGGGWCGRVIQADVNAALWELKRYIGDRLALVGTGGVLTGKDARHKLALGADAVQVVSALLLRGHQAAKEIEEEI